jgi:hypothetical protein
MTSNRPVGFGCRVRAARGYAGITQAELGRRIEAGFPGVSCSIATVKRLEFDDPGVRGSLEQWSVWVASVTGMPQWCLEQGFVESPSFSVGLSDVSLSLDDVLLLHAEGRLQPRSEG